MKSLAALPVFMVLLVFTHCRPDAEPPCTGTDEFLPGPIIRIEYGTSFGMCGGYCWSAVTLSPGQPATFTKRGWNNSVEEVTCTGSVMPCHDTWPLITGAVDLDKFFAMDEIIGCPDCADGGAEWIEIETEDDLHRVTYDYNSPPQSLQALAKKLDEVKSSFSNCE